VLDASNGNDAIRLSEEHQGTIDIIVTDVVMLQLGGRELAEKLSVTRPGMRVLYMSGYTDDAIVRHGGLQRARVIPGKAVYCRRSGPQD
jgi:YesN/AraC family two-component response regulator